MLTFDHTEVSGWDAAIRGMRNPMNSWDKSDSITCNCQCYGCKYHGDVLVDRTPCLAFAHKDDFIAGPNDHDLMTRLRNAGTDHRKFMRMILVSVDITGPLYWWKEFDTYKVGTVANSCSTMHKIHAKEFTVDDFSCEHLDRFPTEVLVWTIKALNVAREDYIRTNDKKHWWQMIQLLPSSYNQKRTVLLNYEVLANIYKSRHSHKLDEWSVDFMSWIDQLPYNWLIKGCQHEA